MIAVILMLFMLQLAVTPSESIECQRLECHESMKCEHGFQVDEADCPICACRGCDCPHLNCNLGMECEFGLQVDEFGCPICACRDLTQI
ncbi:BPTI/Kunitz domain-containing protein 4-like [Photinus pyralis]|uniref:BPTI/Kunitz domain-containing protein 4-like n=1 Tax=Photinus pyralis TaxID=7054 RepID=UPI0012670545|nr:BPTI/Kunitz domain-containing protein 4-like [Photinus pyralis]